MWKPRLPGWYWLFLIGAAYTFLFVQDPNKDIIALVLLGLGVLAYLHRRLSQWNQRRRNRSGDRHLRKSLDHDYPQSLKGAK